MDTRYVIFQALVISFPQKIAFAQSLDAPTNFYHQQNIDLAIVLGI